ncbi:MAG: cysteine desulfurase [Crocinitomicaceae bacterium]|nr:cysteine desulfurase [Crocinitomicaceae bacterium]
MKNTSQSNLIVENIRAQFPILTERVNGRDLIYFDNAATSQKPSSVIDKIKTYYENENANIHRGVHSLSQEATTSYEQARLKVSNYLNAKSDTEVIFTKGTTDGINLIASSFGELLNPGDEVLISAMEHHSNIVPWQLLESRKKIKLKVIPIHKSGEIDLDAFENLLNEKTRLVSITHISNSLGIINPIKEIILKSHLVGAKVLIDGAQSIQHEKIDLQELDCDFFVFSGHKVYGPTGIGVLYGKSELLNIMPPYQGGGDMIEKVSFEKTTFNVLPFKFEAGTPNIVGGIALGTAFDFLDSLNFEQCKIHEMELLRYAEEQLTAIPGLQIFGNSKNKTSVISFNVGDIHPFDIGTLLDKQGVAVRTGHHCTQPIMDFYQIPGTIRVSFSIYNTKDEIDVFMAALNKSIQILS